MRRFNTAIFYDVENLTQGNNFSKDFINNFSFKPIHQRIQELPIVDQISLQRAYANWSDPRLSVLRTEINQLGIEPIQIFGFSRHQIKNAADIQLAVDAMDILLTRAHIDVYVVVSGDGGFASLAKKLHEYGRQVVACAYGTAANEILKSVCDDFIELSPPLELPELSKSTGFNQNILSNPVFNDKGYGIGITHPLVVRLAQSLAPLTDQSFEQVISYGQTLLHWFYEDSEARQQMNNGGIHLSVVREAFKYGIPGFKPERIGFGKFAELLQLICTQQPFCLGMQPPSNLLLLCREHLPPDVDPLGDLHYPDLHTVDRYKNLLSSGKPRIVINDIFKDRLLFAQVLLQAWSHRDQPQTLPTWIDDLAQRWSQFSREDWSNCCLTLVNCGFLQGTPEGHPLGEQHLYWAAPVPELDPVFQKIQDTAYHKLEGILSQSLEMEIFNQLFPWLSGTL